MGRDAWQVTTFAGEPDTLVSASAPQPAHQTCISLDMPLLTQTYRAGQTSSDRATQQPSGCPTVALPCPLPELRKLKKKKIKKPQTENQTTPRFM